MSDRDKSGLMTLPHVYRWGGGGLCADCGHAVFHELHNRKFPVETSAQQTDNTATPLSAETDDYTPEPLSAPVLLAIPPGYIPVEQARTETQAAVQEMKEMAAQHFPIQRTPKEVMGCICGWKSNIYGYDQQSWAAHIRALPVPTDALAKALRERDGEWIDAIEDTLHFGVVPETMEAAMQAAKDWLVEHDEKMLSAQLPTLREHDARVVDKAFERLCVQLNATPEPSVFSTTLWAVVKRLVKQAMDKVKLENTI